MPIQRRRRLLLFSSFFLAACWLCTLLPASAAAFDTATPEAMNMDSAVLNDLTAALQNLTDHRFIPGATVMVARRGKLVYQATVGYPRDDMIFRIYSMSKPLTTAAVLLLVQDGKLKLDDPICQHIPAFANPRVITGANPRPNYFQSVPARSPITVHQLLTHTSGLVYGYSNTTVDALYRRDLLPTYFARDATLEQFIARLARHPLLFHPGTHCWYSGSFDLLGYLVEVVSGMPFDEFLRTRLLSPLGMVDTDFWVHPEKAHRLADLMIMNGTSTPSVKAPEWEFAGNNYKVKPLLKLGGSGMVSTAQDYMHFLLFLYNGGMHEGKRVLRADLVERFFENAIPELRPFTINRVQHENLSFTYGPQVQLVETEASPKGEITEGGFANTKMVVSRERELVFVTMTNKFIFPNLAAKATREHVYSSQRDFPPKHGASESVLDNRPDGLRSTEALLRALPFLKNENPFAAQNSEAARQRQRQSGFVDGGSGEGTEGEDNRRKVEEEEDRSSSESPKNEKLWRDWEIEAQLS